MKDSQDIIPSTIRFVKNQLQGIEAGHDWFHVERVYKMAMRINQSEKADEKVVALGALLHDVADSKFHNGDESIGPKTACEFLEQEAVDAETIGHVVKIIENISFKGGNFTQKFYSKELAVIQDADRLDAMGAIGIARTFNYGGFKNRELYNPEVSPNLNMDKETYKNTVSPTVNHFYEKLLLLKDRMHTETAKKIAEDRHRFMEEYLTQFFAEWEGER